MSDTNPPRESEPVRTSEARARAESEWPAHSGRTSRSVGSHTSSHLPTYYLYVCSIDLSILSIRVTRGGSAGRAGVWRKGGGVGVALFISQWWVAGKR